MTKKFRYKRIFLLASLQSSGNVAEYFSQNTEKLVIFFIMPRPQNEPNLVRVYKKGRLLQEKRIISSSNLFLYYFLIYFNYLRIMFNHFSPQEKFYFLHGHPLFFFFNSLLKNLREFEIVYWIGDYYPPHSLWLRLYRRLVSFYHHRTKYTLYLTDRINKKMNGKVINLKNKKTVMWGTNLPKNYQKNFPKDSVILCFIGLVKKAQGLPLIFKVLKKNKKIKLKILGFCPEALYKNYQKIIQKTGIGNRVYFPNKFINDLTAETKDCHIGIALYKNDPVVYFADPGKIKTYARIGLPIIMSDISEIAQYIRKFRAGEVAKRETDAVYKAIEKIKNNYQDYIKGLKRFNQHFYYKRHYKKAFEFLEER